jgi:SagB-type dehydrogenase family enzyme
MERIVSRIMYAMGTLALITLSLTAPSYAETTQQVIKLPPPRYKGEVSLEEAIFKRRSVRHYKDEPVSLDAVSQLLWAGAGQTVDAVTGPTRSYPSAGGIYPLQIYVVAGKIEGLRSGLYQYEWQGHTLLLIKEGDMRPQLSQACLGQKAVAQAPVSIVLAADYPRTSGRYGKRGESRYVPMDTGAAGENISLQAEALGLGTVIAGAFSDENVKEVLDIEETPLYVMPVGKPE